MSQLDMKRLCDDASKGVLPALKILGDLYLNGYKENNIEPDLNKAIGYYEQACDGGMEDAILELGYIYCSGKYMEPDYTKGLLYYERAAAMGNTTAMGNLGMSYCKGFGVEKDEKKGFEYFKKAAEGGHPAAMMQVAEMYQSGFGVEKDEKQALYWTQKAKEQEKSSGLSIEEAFKENLKFISRDTLDVQQVHKIFQNTEEISLYTLGTCEFKTGRVITADPLCYLQSPKNVSAKARTIAPGAYPVQVAVMKKSIAGLRIAAARLKLKENEAVSYELANGIRTENGEEKETFAGFPVECGMGCFCDEQAAQSYWSFLEKWYQEHEGGNIYDDYFAELFAESYRQVPDYQREEGDLLMWINPLDNSQIAMFATGMGDGFYTDYWGVDAQGDICELVILFMNPELFGIRL